MDTENLCSSNDNNDDDPCGTGCRGGMVNSQDESTSDPCQGLVTPSTISFSCSSDKTPRAKGGSEVSVGLSQLSPD